MQMKLCHRSYSGGARPKPK